jgi:hypothetical protein
MKTVIFSFLVLICITTSAQQQIVFTKTDSSKTVVIKLKNLVRLSYGGYMQQPQEVEGRVSTITDSTITLTPRKRLLQRISGGAQTILVKDITGFRKYSNFRPASEIIYGIAGIGITGTVAAILSKANLSPALGFVTAAAVPIVTNGLQNIVFSSRIKNRLNNGWQMKLEPIK